MAIVQEYEIVIGLEVHAQLTTRTKLFCGDTTLFGQEPNTQVSAISLGHPGTLPRLNAEAIEKAVLLGLACHCEIVQHNYFARKNYFYPDLPKGYQISQHTTPICTGGYVTITVDQEEKKVRLNRIHMEEDAGKSIHTSSDHHTNLDYNRAGMPLLEIVTEPDLRSAEEAFAFVTELRRLVRQLQVCDGNMEQGSLRCDVNISARRMGDPKLGTKVEIKNLNSIRFIKKAVEQESQRLIQALEASEIILQETRGLNEEDFTTYPIRVKEDEDDYRYFPEPDLPAFYISTDQIERLRSQLPESWAELKERLKTTYQLSEYDALQLANDPDLMECFEQLAKKTGNNKAAANWVTGPVKNYLNEEDTTQDIQALPIDSIAKLIELVAQGKINFGTASQKVFPQLVVNPDLNIETYLEEKGLYLQTSSSEIDQWIHQALEKHAARIPDYKKGKKGLVSVFVGEVMKASKGTADAKLVTEKIIEKLND
ncbi:MAG TPA: Asp-tRNA(Asn)/Glu-tRNA(Gln) amidotransferase subunit GatB [Flavisolibacter sp.]|jgi:aspartyl-tRNA(Asn)/glutamyl-tRNA(Gln) amidotransferase subunit B|nr:Asp-tRNA(Asn)/Glu-tRNA(Gln) amidotransferase subunit GatB [Flavisolibacter sp.]